MHTLSKFYVSNNPNPPWGIHGHPQVSDVRAVEEYGTAVPAHPERTYLHTPVHVLQVAGRHRAST